MHASYVENVLEDRGGKLGLKPPPKACSCFWAHQMMHTHLRQNFKSIVVEGFGWLPCPD